MMDHEMLATCMARIDERTKAIKENLEELKEVGFPMCSVRGEKIASLERRIRWLYGMLGAGIIGVVSIVAKHILS